MIILFIPITETQRYLCYMVKDLLSPTGFVEVKYYFSRVEDDNLHGQQIPRLHYFYSSSSLVGDDFFAKYNVSIKYPPEMASKGAGMVQEKAGIVSIQNYWLTSFVGFVFNLVVPGLFLDASSHIYMRSCPSDG